MSQTQGNPPPQNEDGSPKLYRDALVLCTRYAKRIHGADTDLAADVAARVWERAQRIPIRSLARVCWLALMAEASRRRRGSCASLPEVIGVEDTCLGETPADRVLEHPDGLLALAAMARSTSLRQALARAAESGCDKRWLREAAGDLGEIWRDAHGG